MNYTNNANLPQPIVDAVINDDYDAGDADISVTSLINPPRIRTLKGKFDGDITEDVADLVYALIGKTMHKILEKSNDGGLIEERLYTEVNGWKISGQFDRLHEGVLQDYKLASVWEYMHGLKPEKTQQLNIYAHLCRKNGYEVKRLEIIYMFRDWSKSKARYDREYPQTQVVVIPIEMWPEQETKDFILKRVKIHQETPMAECTSDEQWAKETVYAIKKEGRKTAVRLHKVESDANEHLDTLDGKHSIETRLGEKTRCQYYCNVNKFCDQYSE